MAHVGKLEPSVLAIPIPLKTAYVPKALPIKIEYLQEVFVDEVVDCHGSSGWRVWITGAKTSFGEKLVRVECQVVEHTVAEEIPRG